MRTICHITQNNQVKADVKNEYINMDGNKMIFLNYREMFDIRKRMVVTSYSSVVS